MRVQVPLDMLQRLDRPGPRYTSYPTVPAWTTEFGADQWREALGTYFSRPTWRRNGYIVAITKRVKGDYTEEFQDRWAPHVRRAERGDR